MEVSPSAAGTLRALRRLVRALRLADRAAESRLGLSAAQLFVLQRLAEGPAGSMAELAGRTLTDASSVSVVVQRLVERGLVVRATAPDDARRTTLRLSASGKRLLAGAPRSPQLDLIASLEQLSAVERNGARAAPGARGARDGHRRRRARAHVLRGRGRHRTAAGARPCLPGPGARPWLRGRRGPVPPPGVSRRRRKARRARCGEPVLLGMLTRSDLVGCTGPRLRAERVAARALARG